MDYHRYKAIYVSQIILNSIADTKKYGFVPQNIGQCCIGNISQHKGYI